MKALQDITVLLPVYNGERHLRDCINSVITQTLSSFKLVIGDDHSTDETQAIIESFDDTRITLVKQKRNLGLFANLNSLIPLVTTPLVRLLGQDDILMPTCLEEEVAFFRKHPEIAMSYCKAHFVDSSGVKMGASPIHDLPEVLSAEDATQLFFFLGSLPGNISTVCIRSEALTSVGQFDVSYGVAADYEMWTRLCRNAPLGIIHQYLVNLRLHEGQLSRQIASVAENAVATRRVANALLPILPQRYRRSALRYMYFRKDVMDAHIAFRLLLWGAFVNYSRIVRAMGPVHYALGSLIGLLTLNNRLYRPKRPALQVEQRV